MAAAEHRVERAANRSAENRIIRRHRQKILRLSTMFKALKDAKRRVVQTVYEKTTNAAEKTVDERTDKNFSNFCEMIDDMNECGAGWQIPL